MKSFALLAGVALLAACSQKSDYPASDATASDAAAMPADVATGPATANGAMPGSYDVTNPDGSTAVATLMADGTYVDRDAAGKVLEKGMWATKDGKTCFDAEGDTAEVCYTESNRAADGSFDATDDKGAVSKIKPHAG